MDLTKTDRLVLAALWHVRPAAHGAIVEQIGELTGILSDTITARLAAMQQAGVVAVQRHGSHVFYIPSHGAPRALRDGTSPLIDRLAAAA